MAVIAQASQEVRSGIVYATIVVLLVFIPLLAMPGQQGRMFGPLATAYIIVGLLGGIILYVIGFFYKIVPLLAWTVRYRDRMGRGDAPTIAQTFSSRVAHVQLGLMALGVTLLATGTLAGSAHVTRCGAVLFLAGVILFLTQIHRVVAGKVA